MDLDIQIIRTKSPKEKPQSEANLSFGKLFTDHMFLVEYTEGRAGTTPGFSPTAPWPSIRPPLCSITARRSSRV